MKLWFEIVTATVMTALAVWQWLQLRRHPGDVALRVLAVGVTTIAFVLTMSIDLPPFEYVDDLLSTISFSNIAWLFLFYCYSVFFLLAKMSDEEKERRRITRQALVEFGVYLLFLSAALLALLTGDPEFWGKYRDPEEYRSVRNLIYYTGAAVYPIALWVLGTVRAIGYLRLLRHRWARLAAIGVLVGMGMMALGVSGISVIRQILYVVYPGSRWPELRGVYNVFRLGGQMVLALALASVPLLALVVRVLERRARERKRRYARALDPLWRTLTAEFPQVCLPAVAASSERAPNLDRMMIEVSDGLAYLAPWADEPEGPGEAGATPWSVPEQIGTALAAKRLAGGARWAESTPPPGDRELPQWEPDFDQQDWDGRARWMTELSRRLERRGDLSAPAIVGSE